jgi:hypothetical protein
VFNSEHITHGIFPAFLLVSRDASSIEVAASFELLLHLFITIVQRFRRNILSSWIDFFLPHLTTP